MVEANKLYFEMLRIRMIEEAIAKRYPEKKMRCPVHLSIGQEAAAVGVVAAMRPTDKMVSTHRGHAHYLAKGGPLNGLIGELYGKASGCSRGNGGSMHLIDLSCDFWGSTSIVGGTIPIGVGLAFADKLRGENHATVICLGDAALEQGVFHEAANFAALQNLKVLFLCENNLYSCYTKIWDRQPNRHFLNVARGHNLQYRQSQPNNVDHVREMATQLLSLKGPGFLEVPTYRHLQHCGPDNDDHLQYRPQEEVDWWKSKDPLKINPCTWNMDTENNLRIKISDEISEAFRFAEEAPWPEPTSMYAS